ncbi:MAG: phosphatidylinositol transfer protein, partial [Myxococcales bacterium]|nr:phosphatidylinositol transfer protein [Myxococcales bacterium]
VEGVVDTGGRVYFEIPRGKELGLGRHRVHLIVKGDLSSTDQFIEVIEPTAQVFLSDVDGTLTVKETEEFSALLAGVQPAAHPDAAAVLGELVQKGYRPFYLTARPEWLTERTRRFLHERGFPPGVVHTTLSKIGALGDKAVQFKSGELAALAMKGIVPKMAFGNTHSDTGAYQNAGIMPLHNRIFFQLSCPHGGRRIEAYGELLSEFNAAALTANEATSPPVK